VDGRRQQRFADLMAREVFPFEQQHLVTLHCDQARQGGPAGPAANDNEIKIRLLLCHVSALQWGGGRAANSEPPRYLAGFRKPRQAGSLFGAFCRDLDLVPRVCRPYRARTKGKVESGVKFVKHNALAGLAFVSFAALQAQLQRWMAEADQRIHGTTCGPAHESLGPLDEWRKKRARDIRWPVCYKTNRARLAE
jgi:hypothetical protein